MSKHRIIAKNVLIASLITDKSTRILIYDFTRKDTTTSP